MSDFSYYFAQIIDGIAYGSIYGIFALAIVMLYRANKLINLAQSELTTLAIILGLYSLKHFNYYISILITLAGAFIGGSLLHMTVMRFITERKRVVQSSETIVTIAFFTIFNSLSSYIVGDEPQPFPSPFGTESTQILGVGISHHSIGILCLSLVFVFIVFLIFKFTRIGLIFEAVSENITASRLLGIRASNVLAMAWGFTLLTSTIGGILIAPVLFVTPSMMTSIFTYSLISVVIGGLESPLGALVGGIIVGIVENLAANLSFIGSELKFVAVMVLLLVILIIRPRGIWGRAEARRV